MRPTVVSVAQAVAASPVVVLDHYQSPATCAIGVIITGGTATYTVQHTFDDPFATTFNPATATWLPHATLASLSANADGNYAYAPRACRLNVTVNAGNAATVTMTINQAGII